jgi:DNA-binding transcriptional ArsR family regulator
MLVGRSSPFGGQTRTSVLIALALLGESHLRELARVLQISLSGVQQATRSLERDGLVAGTSVGRSRVYRIDPRYFGYKELREYALRLAQPEEKLRQRVEALRRRPRRAGKPLS